MRKNGVETGALSVQTPLLTKVCKPEGKQERERGKGEGARREAWEEEGGGRRKKEGGGRMREEEGGRRKKGGGRRKEGQEGGGRKREEVERGR